MPHRALVMSGGGSRGAFELGAVDYLVNDVGVDFDVLAGVSTGSLNAVLLAQGAGLSGLREKLDELKSLWFGIDSSNAIYRRRILGSLLVLFAKNSLYSSAPLAEKIRRHVSPALLEASGKELRIGAVRLASGDYVSANQNSPEIREWTLGSASIPMLFPPIWVGGEPVVDGGVRKLTPLEDSFQALRDLDDRREGEPDEMYVVLASPLVIGRDPAGWRTGLEVAKRAVAILMNEMFREDLSYALAVNQSVRGYQRLESELTGRLGREETERLLGEASFPFRPPKFRYVRIWTVVPDVDPSEALEFDPVKVRAAFEAGRQAARRPLDEQALQGRLNRRSS